jgi:transcriptional regulator with XRE-family HTH domain
MDELADCLRHWRDRLDPVELGLPAGRRRAPGLRREEVARLAGVSADYLARLEQGRAHNPSVSVLAALARTLRLTHDERAHLFRVAGHVEPEAGRIDQHITPGVQRVLDRLADVPVMVVDATWEIVALNPPATALLGDLTAGTARDRNILWRHFTGEHSRLVRTEAETAASEAESVADLRAAAARYPEDDRLRRLIADLRAVSPRFDELWARTSVGRRASGRKAFEHPEVGLVTLDCDVLTVQDSDLRLVVYTAAPGSPDANALALLGAVGLQTFAG